MASGKSFATEGSLNPAGDSLLSLPITPLLLDLIELGICAHQPSVVDVDGASAKAFQQNLAHADGVVNHPFVDARGIVTEEGLQIPAAVVVNDQDDPFRTGQIHHELHPAPSGPRKLRQKIEGLQNLRTSGNRHQGVMVQLEVLAQKILKMRLEARVAAMDNQRCTLGGRTHFLAAVDLPHYVFRILLATSGSTFRVDFLGCPVCRTVGLDTELLEHTRQIQAQCLHLLDQIEENGRARIGKPCHST